MRMLKHDEIECRVNIINEKGLSLLLYKTARVDMAILDELYPMAWECEYKEIKGNLFCGISVYTEKGKLTRWDCGVESREDGSGNEKKGEASDSFKRAGTKWGIGRELYTAPKLIWIKAGDFAMFDNKGKKATYDKFSVSEIGYTDGNISVLKIINDRTGKVVFTLGQKQNATPKPSEAKTRCTQLGGKLGITPEERKRLYEESGRSFEKLQAHLEAMVAQSQKEMDIF